MKQNLKYGKLTVKEAEVVPWDRLLVYIIFPYKINREVNAKIFTIKTLTMIKPADRWLEIVQYNGKQAATIVNLVYHTWFCRCPLPVIIMYDHGENSWVTRSETF